MSPSLVCTRPQGVAGCLSLHHAEASGVGNQVWPVNKSLGCLNNLQNLPLLFDEEWRDKIQVYEPLSESLGRGLAQFLQLFHDFQIL